MGKGVRKRASGSTSAPWALLGASCAAGLGFWGMSPWLTGTAEPWDGDVLVWMGAWLVAALLGGAIGTSRALWHGICLPLGFAWGQILFTSGPLFRGDWRLAILGWTFVMAYAFVSTVLVIVMVAVLARVKAYREPGPKH